MSGIAFGDDGRDGPEEIYLSKVSGFIDKHWNKQSPKLFVHGSRYRRVCALTYAHPIMQQVMHKPQQQIAGARLMSLASTVSCLRAASAILW